MTYLDIDFLPWNRFQDLKLSSLNIQTAGYNMIIASISATLTLNLIYQIVQYGQVVLSIDKIVILFMVLSHFFIFTYYVKWVKTSWADSIFWIVCFFASKRIILFKNYCKPPPSHFLHLAIRYKGKETSHQCKGWLNFYHFNGWPYSWDSVLWDCQLLAVQRTKADIVALHFFHFPTLIYLN